MTEVFPIHHIILSVLILVMTCGCEGCGSSVLSGDAQSNELSPEDITLDLSDDDQVSDDIQSEGYVDFTLRTWAKSYGGEKGEFGDFLQETADGGYMVGGATLSFGEGYHDLWILKLDGNGNVLWEKAFGTEDSEVASSLTLTQEGDYIGAGFIDNAELNDDIWIFSLDGNGNIIWQKAYGGARNESACCIRQTIDEGFVLAGDTNSFEAEYIDIFLLKIDTLGNVDWLKLYGGIEPDYGYSVDLTLDNGYIITGETNSFELTSPDFWIFKVNEDGNVIWQKSYGGEGNDTARSVRQTSDGGYVVAGITTSFGEGERDIWVLKLDIEGNIEWQKTFGTESQEYAGSIEPTLDNGYVIVGYVKLDYELLENNFDILVLKLDADGDVEWGKTYGGESWDEANIIKQMTDGGYMIVGRTSTFGVGNIWSLKIDSRGNISEACPGGIGMDFTVAVHDTSVSPIDTFINPVEIIPTVTETSVTSRNTNAIVDTQCSQ